MMGDTGEKDEAATALAQLSTPASSPPAQRTHWGVICFQATADLDDGPIWAWEQYALPPISTLTKSRLYQGLHSQAAIISLTCALFRVHAVVGHAFGGLHSGRWSELRPQREWAQLSVTSQLPFQGGRTHNRPQIKPLERKPDIFNLPACDIARFVNASDSQPGARVAFSNEPKIPTLFAYGAHVHHGISGLPVGLYHSKGYASFDEVPNGTIIAKRAGAVLIKTSPCSHGRTCQTCGVAVWLTHGRVPKKIGSPLEPKIPMAQAIEDLGANYAQAWMENVEEWPLLSFDEEPGMWKEVYVKYERYGGKTAALVYWNF
jgi:hypothetical protein